MAVATAQLIPSFFHNVYAYREYLKQSVLRDLRNKYKRSVLGYLWTMVHPLAMMGVLAIVFSKIMGVNARDYAVFLFSGLLAWNFFNSTSMMSLGSIRANSRLFSQIPVPKYIFVLSIAFSNLLNFCLAIFPLLLITIIMGRTVHPSVLCFPIVVLPLLFVTIGVSLLLAASNVFFDDTLHLAEVGMSLLYFLSPVLYDRTHLPPNLVRWLELNPLFHQIEFIRGIFYQGVLPDPLQFGLNLLFSLFLLLFGLMVFRQSEDKFLYFI